MKMSKIKLIFGLAILIRLILGAFSFHPDIQAFNLGGWVVSQGHIFDFYDYLSRLPQDNPLAQNYPADFFIYPPLIYFYHGLFAFLFNNLLRLPAYGVFVVDLANALGNWQLNFHLLLIKLPYLIFDLLSAYLIMKLFSQKREQILAMVLWLFNPVNLYATYLMGQFDVIPTFFVLLALYLVVNRSRFAWQNNLLAAAALGLGASFKIYPLFFLIPLAALERSWLSRIKIVLLGGSVYLLTIFPFIFSRGFRSSALVSNLTLKSLYPQIPISGGESILLFMLFLVFLYLLFLRFKSGSENLWQRFFLVLLLFFTFTHYHPQWFLWLIPFFIIDLVRSNFRNLLAVLLALFSFKGLLFFFDPSLTLGFFAPLFPALYNLPSIWQILHLNVDYNFLRSILQTLFAGTALYFIYIYFPKSVESETKTDV